MAQRLRFAHINLVARDWRRLARFYEQALGCMPLPPERDYSGSTLEAGTGLPGAHLTGVHLRLPGFDDGKGPTLEIYQYEPEGENSPKGVNRIGYGHICFQVGDVEKIRQQILRYGGSELGEIVTLSPSVDARVTWCYVRDPEGNIIELQRWRPFGFMAATGPREEESDQS